jgi:hypothetical protein
VPKPKIRHPSRIKPKGTTLRIIKLLQFFLPYYKSVLYLSMLDRSYDNKS